MADYYKSLNLDKQRQSSSMHTNQEFLCTESLNKIKIQKPHNRDPIGGYGSSSDDLGDLNDESSGNEVYMDTAQARGQPYQTPLLGGQKQYQRPLYRGDR
jgi:hypothetical protein